MAHYLKRTGENTWEFTCTEPATADCHWQCSNDTCYSENDHLDGDSDDEDRNDDGECLGVGKYVAKCFCVSNIDVASDIGGSPEEGFWSNLNDSEISLEIGQSAEITMSWEDEEYCDWRIISEAKSMIL